jgi:hypothetical protein
MNPIEKYRAYVNSQAPEQEDQAIYDNNWK